MKTVAFHTVGCKLNQYETNDIERQFTERGWRVVAFGEPADVVVVNTCTVTAQSDSRCRAALRKARRESPGATRDRDGLLRPGAARGGRRDAGGRPRARQPREGARSSTTSTARAGRAPGGSPRPRSTPGTRPAFAPVAAFAGHTRAFVKIQDGCDAALRLLHRPAGARPEPQPARRRRARAGGGARSPPGYREMVLTGVHLGTWGRDLEPPADPRRPAGAPGRDPGPRAAAALVHRADRVHPRAARAARGGAGDLPAPAHPAPERLGRRPARDAPPLRAGAVRAGRRAARAHACPTPASARTSSPASPASARRTSRRRVGLDPLAAADLPARLPLLAAARDPRRRDGRPGARRRSAIGAPGCCASSGREKAAAFRERHVGRTVRALVQGQPGRKRGATHGLTGNYLTVFVRAPRGGGRRFPQPADHSSRGGRLHGEFCD